MQIEKIYIHTHRSFPLCVCVCVFVYDSVQHHSGSTASVITNSLTVLLGWTHKILLSYNQQNILKNVYNLKKNLTKKSCCCSKNNATDLICWCSLSANICCLSHLLSWDKDVVICVCVCLYDLEYSTCHSNTPVLPQYHFIPLCSLLSALRQRQ